LQCESESERECGERECYCAGVCVVCQGDCASSRKPECPHGAVSSHSSRSPPIRPSRQATSCLTIPPTASRRISTPAHFQSGHVHRLLPYTTRLHLPCLQLPRSVSYKLHHTKSPFLLLCLLLIIYPVRLSTIASLFPFYHSNLPCHAISPTSGTVCPPLADQLIARRRFPSSPKLTTPSPRSARLRRLQLTSDEHSTSQSSNPVP
jgi:hypothetical protein